MTSEVTSDLKIQLSDLDYLCYHVSLASKGLHELNCNRAEEVYDPLTCVASPQVIMTIRARNVMSTRLSGCHVNLT